MRVPCKGVYNATPRQLMRKCGYGEFLDPNTKKYSYVRRMRPGNFYPRFHVYVEQKEEYFVVDLHLDQKKASYAGTAAHAGEYDGPVVEQELKRIYVIIQTCLRVPNKKTP